MMIGQMTITITWVLVLFLTEGHDTPTLPIQVWEGVQMNGLSRCMSYEVPEKPEPAHQLRWDKYGAPQYTAAN